VSSPQLDPLAPAFTNSLNQQFGFLSLIQAVLTSSVSLTHRFDPPGIDYRTVRSFARTSHYEPSLTSVIISCGPFPLFYSSGTRAFLLWTSMRACLPLYELVRLDFLERCWLAAPVLRPYNPLSSFFALLRSTAPIGTVHPAAFLLCFSSNTVFSSFVSPRHVLNLLFSPVDGASPHGRF